MSDKELPRNIHAEQCVLEAMTLSRRAANEVVDIVKPGDFYRPAHQVIFAALSELAVDGQPTDGATLLSALMRSGDLHRVGGAPYLAELSDKIPTSASGGHFAKLVADTAVLRRLVEVGLRVADFGYSGEGDVADLAEQARAAVDSISSPEVAESESTIGELLPEIADEMERPDEPGDSVELPWSDMQSLFGGLRPGQLTVIGARPSVGKTVVGVDIARNAALHHKIPTVIFSLEMTRRDLGQRIVSAEAQIPLHAIRNKLLDDDEWERFAIGTARFNDAPLRINDAYDINVAKIRSRLRTLSRSQEYGLVVVDYLQLMSGSGRSENRQQEVSEITRSLKKLAGEFGLPVVLLSQLNRSSEHRTNKRPTMSDLRESGAVEQDSDNVILLYREDMHEKESPRSGEIDFLIEKNRQGARGCTITAAFQGHYSRVVDMAPAHPTSSKEH